MPPAYEILLLNTAIPQIQAAQAGDTYVVPRDIAFSTVANLANGTNLLPSLTFSSDTNTGIYREGADALGFTAGGGTNQMVLTSTGLGIGTNNPAYKLDVVGTGSIISASRSDTNRADIIVTNSGGTVSFGINNSTGSWLTNGLPYYGYILGPSSASYGLQFGVGTSNTAALTIDPSGNLGLGVTPSTVNTLSSYKSFEVGQAGNGLYAGNNQVLFGANVKWDGGTAKYAQSAANYPATLYNQGVGAHSWSTAASGTAGAAISFTQAMTLDASGNLGIGETNPTTRLHTSIARAATITSAIFGTTGTGVVNDQNRLVIKNVNTLTGQNNGVGIGGLLEASASNQASLLFYTDSGTATTERARITSGGNLLVGTDNSAENAGLGMKVLNTGGTVALVSSASDSSQQGFEMYSTTAAAYRLYINYAGTINATSTTISAISDQRLKENIQDLDVGLDKIMALKPRKFDWKTGKGKDIKGDRGWIAQEFEQVFPDLIDEWRDPAPEGEEPYKSVRADLIPVLVKAIQEQQAMIEELKAKVAALKGA